jgi:hypothetical protein
MTQQPENYIILGFRDGKIYPHQNRVSGAMYVYYKIEDADKKAYQIEAKSKKLNHQIDCMVVAVKPVEA